MKSKWNEGYNTASRVYLKGLVSASISKVCGGYKAAIYGFHEALWSPYFQTIDEAKEWCDTTMKQLISEE